MAANTRNIHVKIQPESGQKHGMTIGESDDVESMLSDHIAGTSDGSQFKNRLQSNIGQNFGGGLAAGDSTFRCNESHEEDRGLVSESEDGWHPDKKKQDDQDDNEFSDISEHSSDERSDSSGVLEDPQGVIAVKKKKPKGEKGEKRKKKKKKAATDDVLDKKEVQRELKDDELNKKLIN